MPFAFTDDWWETRRMRSLYFYPVFISFTLFCLSTLFCSLLCYSKYCVLSLWWFVTSLNINCRVARFDHLCHYNTWVLCHTNITISDILSFDVISKISYHILCYCIFPLDFKWLLTLTLVHFLSLVPQ